VTLDVEIRKVRTSSVFVRIASVTVEEWLSEFYFKDVTIATDEFCSCDTLYTIEGDLFVIINVILWRKTFRIFFSLDPTLFESFNIRTLHVAFKIQINQEIK
jgi:hypothetical protein